MIERQFFDAVAAAGDHAALAEACAALQAGKAQMAKPAGDGFRLALSAALRRHLDGVSQHPAFRQWLDAYFGIRPVGFRSQLQQPGYLYYPSLPPKPWFATADVPALRPLVERIPAVAAELRARFADAEGFSPYVALDAARDRRWRTLAGSDAWSSLHLIKGGEWNEAMLAALPETTAFLRAAPLAMCPPHAPECFVSRLLPCVELPPHFGVSNIKLTVHLAVDLPPSGCTITVGGVVRTWSYDDFLIFDDSFLHSAANLSAAPRTVMIFDVWHPVLSDDERAALAYAIPALDMAMRAAGDWL